MKFLEPEIGVESEKIIEENRVNIENHGIDVELLEATYRKYVTGELEADEKVGFKAGKRPISLIMQTVPEKRPLAISEAVMQNSKLNGHESLMESNMKFEIIQREWYDMLVSEEELQAMERENKERRKEKTPKAKEKYDYEYE